MGAGKLNERVSFERATDQTTALGKEPVWNAHGQPIWAERRDISDGERMRAGLTEATITKRFKVRYDSFTSQLTPKDRLVFAGARYEIFGIKEVAHREYLEITSGRLVV